MKTHLLKLSKLVSKVAILLFIGITQGIAQVNINLDNPNIYYDGILYPIITSNSVTFNRHSPAAYADPSSGIYYTPCNLTRATQSGVRIRFKTASPTIKLNFAAQTTPEGYFYNNSSTPPADGFTVSVGGTVINTFTNTLSFTITNPTPGTPTEFEVNLPILWSVIFTGMQLESGQTLIDAGANTKPKYAAFGTSISMGTGQNNSTQTYPYQVAKAKNWNLHSFAVAGSSIGWQLAYNIKGKQFDVISVEQGFNDWASEYLTLSLVEELELYGRFIDSLRKFQPTAKIYCIAPIATSYVNAKQRYTLDDFRNGICNLVDLRKTSGDKNIFCINGASISDPTMTGDGIHLNIPGAAKFATSLTPLMVSAGTNKGYIPANDSYFTYSGRINFSNPKRPSFSYPGVSVKAKFQGTIASVIIKDFAIGGAQNTNYFNVLIDGGTPIRLEVNSTDTIYSVATNLTDSDHTIEIIKRTESSVGKSEFRGMILDNGKALLSPDDKPSLRFEFIGDSYTCGYGNEVNIPQAGNPNTGFHSINENNYNAWGAIASRTLKADYVCTAASGRGLYRNNTGSSIGTIPSMYDQIIADVPSPAWDHNNYIPNVIVSHLGTNDFFPVSQGSAIDSVAFVNTYITFVNKVRGYYPSACIILAVPNGLSDYYPVGKNNYTHAKNFIKAIVDRINDLGDKKVYNFIMKKQGAAGEPYGEDYHPSFETHQIMANDLVDFVNTLTDCSSGATTEKTPTITFDNMIKTEGDAPFLLNASSNSLGTMTYSVISGGSTATVSPSGQVTILNSGIVLIKVNQAAATGYTAGSNSMTLTILSKTAKDTLAMTTNLALGNNGSWSAQVDQLGSKTNTFTQTGPINADFTQAAKTGANWPWIALVKNTIALTEMTYIKVTYKSNLPVQIALPQAPLSSTGENYLTNIPASNTLTTVLIPITAFAKPSWSTSTIALDLSKITAINFIPVISDVNAGENAIIEISSLVLYKSKAITNLEDNDFKNNITIVNTSDSGITFNIPVDGTYQIHLSSADGKELAHISKPLTKGNQTIVFDHLHLNDKLIIIKIMDNNGIFQIFKNMF
jgi:lysophospholipase L1-like esterase